MAVKGTEEVEQPEYIPKPEDEEGEPVAPVVIKKTAKKKVYAPEIALLDPKPRLYTSTASPNEQPCGKTAKGTVHYMATPGSKNYLQWKVIHPAAEGNCTVRIGLGLDQEEADEGRLLTLKPRDGSANLEGSFPCGREVGYEGKEFVFPKNFTCDSCTLQFEWTVAEDQQIHQCADFMMSNAESKHIPDII